MVVMLDTYVYPSYLKQLLFLFSDKVTERMVMQYE